MKPLKAQIVLSTFNGGLFLENQLKSLQAQSESRWTCFVRDDGSQDNTLEILRAFARQDARFVLLESDGVRLGAPQGFSKLLSRCSPEAPVFFCDQDDLWDPFKISLFLQHFDRSSGSKLLLVSDLSIMNASGVILHGSMMGKLGYDGLHCSFPGMLGQNIFPGCAMAFSGSLLKDIMPVPAEVSMHDWWSVLLALSVGSVQFINRPLVLYRQHSLQASGGVARASFYQKVSGAFLSEHKNLRALMNMRFKLWRSLRTRLNGVPARSPAAENFICLLDSLESADRCSSVLLVLKSKLRMQGVLRTLVFYFGFFLYFDEFKKTKCTAQRLSGRDTSSKT